MNPWWNIPFALFLALALWCRVRPDARPVEWVVSLLGFFGVPAEAAGRGASDLFGIAGTAGLVFVGWADRLAARPDGWMAADALLTALGLGLVGAWALARLTREGQDGGWRGGGPVSRELTMMEVDEMPRRGPPDAPPSLE